MHTPTYRAPRTWRSRPIFGALGLRPASAQHSEAEGEVLRKFAESSTTTVEIGVAEGGSAWEAASVMPADGTLYLIDPYMHQRLPVGPAQTIARRLVHSAACCDVRWLRAYSSDAVRGWSTSIDFLFIDGDHSYDGVRRDWRIGPHTSAKGGTLPCTMLILVRPGRLTTMGRCDG